MGGTARVVDTGVTCRTGGGVAAAWGATEVVTTVRGGAKVGEAVDDGATRGGGSGYPLWLSDSQPLFPGRSDHPGSRSNCHPLIWAWSDRPGARLDHQ
jgi:hypothetical protein